MAFDLSSYQTVEERLREFWKDHPYGRILTDLLAHEDGDYIVRATVYRGDEVGNIPPASTGLAHDAVATLPANMKASALEVCETSAIGRALANLGYAPKGSRPSREEMLKASEGTGGRRGRTPDTAAATAAPSDIQSGGVASDQSEGGAVPNGGEAAASPSDAPRGGTALVALLEAVGGSEQKAINAVNKAMHTNYAKGQLGDLDGEDWTTALRLVRGNA